MEGITPLSRQQPVELCPVSSILQKAQTNVCMHLKYFKELNELYDKVSSANQIIMSCRIEPSAFFELCMDFRCHYFSDYVNEVTDPFSQFREFETYFRSVIKRWIIALVWQNCNNFHVFSEQMGHDKFMLQFLKGLRVWMKLDEKNVYANAGLGFCAKYLATLANDVTLDTHPMLVSTFEFLLNTTSLVANIRFRFCQFVNTFLDFMVEAALEDYICRNITIYMLDRLTDVSPAVRVQAVQALHRLQLPDDPNDEIRRSYLFHLANDPSSAVRIAVITAIGHDFLTIPAIFERLWDVGEDVRRHTYMEMSRYPVKAFKVIDRITLLEQGLNDKSDTVRKTVSLVLLPQWLQSYGGKYIALVTALKIDANEIELKRFVKIAKQSLYALFR